MVQPVEACRLPVGKLLRKAVVVVAAFFHVSAGNFDGVARVLLA